MKNNSLKEKDRQEKATENLPHYRNLPRFELMPDIDYQSGAIIERSTLPLGIKGLYDPTAHKIIISYNLSQREFQAVKEHESVHARGEIDEAKTDARTASFLGYSIRYFGDPKTWQGLN